MNKKERVEAVMAGRKPDRPAVSFWHHFPPEFVAGQPAIDAHMRHLETYDLDFLKIMADNGYPRSKTALSSVSDLASLRVLEGNEEPFRLQLELIAGLRKRLGREVLCCTTVFNAWATLRNLTAPASDKHGPPVIGGGPDPRDQAMTAMVKASKRAVGEALEKIGQSLANFAGKCIEAGADGVYLSCRDDWVEGAGTYDELVRPQDLRILQAAAKGTFNVVHVCGRAVNFERFNEYPAHVLSWADRACGPSIADAKDRVKAVICCGVDNLTTMPQGTPQQCADEVRDAVRQAAGRPMIVAPGCTYDPAVVPKESLMAIRRAVET